LSYKILDIQGIEDDRLRGFHLDEPTPHYAGTANKILLSGWLVGCKEAITRIDISIDSGNTSCCIQSCSLTVERADVVAHFQDPTINPHCGFSTSLMTLGLPENVTLSIHAISESDEDIPIAHIELQRSLTVTNFQSKLQPIIVTTLGRTGSSWLMQLLAKHPAIVVANQHPYETFALEYWLHLVSEQLLSPQQMLSPVDQRRFNRDFLADKQHQDWFQNEYYAQAIGFCQEAIENYYQSIAAQQHISSPQFFAEKIPYFSGDGSTTWRQLGSAVRELYPDAKEIILVRDFRDMVLSALHFGAKDKENTDLEKQKLTAYQNVTKEVAEFSAYYKQNRANTYLVRYEELLFRTTDTLRSLFSSLSIPSSDAILQTVTRDKDTISETQQRHITSKSVGKSVARWKRELPPQLQGEYTKNFKYNLNLFGYDV
jgi:hypothetical protein